MTYPWAIIIVGVLLGAAWVWTTAIQANAGNDATADAVGFEQPLVEEDEGGKWD